jgi:hypothetical protein
MKKINLWQIGIQIVSLFALGLISFSTAGADTLRNVYEDGKLVAQEYIIECVSRNTGDSSSEAGLDGNPHVITMPPGSSYYWCQNVVGETFEALLTKSRRAIGAKDWQTAEYCLRCAFKELRPDDAELLILWKKAEYYYKKEKENEDSARQSVLGYITNMLAEQPDLRLMAFRDWVMRKGDPDGFRIVTKAASAPDSFVSVARVNVRSDPSLQGHIVGKLNKGSVVQVLEEQEGWTRIGEKEWVSSRYLLKLSW